MLSKESKSSNKFQFVHLDLTKPPVEPDPMFSVDEGGITLRWGRSDYFIDWKRLKTKEDILRWICQVGEKEWEDMDVKKVIRFIQAVYHKRKWNMYPNK